MTPTGSDRVKALYGDSVHHIYCPYDLPGAQKRFFDQIHPQLALIVETELWPNTVAEAHKRNIPLIIANARLSEKSAKGYGKLGRLTRNMLGSIHTVACQNQDDGQRFIQLGLPSERLKVTGSVKFDITVSQTILDEAAQLKQQWLQGCGRSMNILISASTHEGEDQPILDAYQQIAAQCPDTLQRISFRSSDIAKVSKPLQKLK